MRHELKDNTMYKSELIELENLVVKHVRQRIETEIIGRISGPNVLLEGYLQGITSWAESFLPAGWTLKSKWKISKDVTHIDIDMKLIHPDYVVILNDPPAPHPLDIY